MPYISIWGILFYLLGAALLLRRPSWDPWARGFPLLCFIGIGWILLNLGVDAYWDYRFDTALSQPDSTDEEMIAATADGAQRAFALLFGWAGAAALAGGVEAVWQATQRLLLRRRPPRDWATLVGKIFRCRKEERSFFCYEIAISY